MTDEIVIVRVEYDRREPGQPKTRVEYLDGDNKAHTWLASSLQAVPEAVSHWASANTEEIHWGAVKKTVLGNRNSDYRAIVRRRDNVVEVLLETVAGDDEGMSIRWLVPPSFWQLQLAMMPP